MDWAARFYFYFLILWNSYPSTISSTFWQSIQMHGRRKDSSVDCTDPKFKSRLTGPTDPTHCCNDVNVIRSLNLTVIRMLIEYV